MKNSNILFREATYDDKHQIAEVLLDFYNTNDTYQSRWSKPNNIKSYQNCVIN